MTGLPAVSLIPTTQVPNAASGSWVCALCSEQGLGGLAGWVTHSDQAHDSHWGHTNTKEQQS